MPLTYNAGLRSSRVFGIATPSSPYTPPPCVRGHVSDRADLPPNHHPRRPSVPFQAEALAECGTCTPLRQLIIRHCPPVNRIYRPVANLHLRPLGASRHRTIDLLDIRTCGKWQLMPCRIRRFASRYRRAVLRRPFA